MNAQNMIEKRARLWEQMKDFLDTHRGDDGCLADDLHQYHACFLIWCSSAVGATQGSQGVAYQFLGVGRGYGQGDQLAQVVLLLVGAKRRGVGIYHHLLAYRVLQA